MQIIEIHKKVILYIFLLFCTLSCTDKEIPKGSSLHKEPTEIIIESKEFIYPEIDFNQLEYSKAGSYIIITPRKGSKTGRLQIKTVRKGAISKKMDSYWAHDLFELCLFKNGEEVPFTTEALPWCLKISSKEGSGLITFVDNKTIMMEAEGVDIKLMPLQSACWVHPKKNNEIAFGFEVARGINQIRPLLNSKVSINETEEPTNLSGSKFKHLKIDITGKQKAGFALRIYPVETLWDEELPSITKAIDSEKNIVDLWMQKMPSVLPEYANAAKQAWYILLNRQVHPMGEYTRQTILMSKNYMNQIWAWDNCFNAMAVASADAELAWGQFHLFFDNQCSTGQLADHINDYEVAFDFTKPPIQGMAILKLIDELGIDKSYNQVQNLYPKLVRSTQWWYEFRDANENGMCAYLHGNDSGWDNSSAFVNGFPAESPDLAAYLAIQLEALSKMAAILGKAEDSQKWKKKADEQIKVLLKNNVKDGKFFFSLENDENNNFQSTSLQNFLPIILGDRLPQNIIDTTLEHLFLKNRFLTKWGLATEDLNSKEYLDDGYWRGPIWALSSYLIFEGLLASGEKEKARIIAKRFCDLGKQNASMCQNFDAQTGEGYRAAGYTGTASVYIMFAHWLHRNP